MSESLRTWFSETIQNLYDIYGQPAIAIYLCYLVLLVAIIVQLYSYLAIYSQLVFPASYRCLCGQGAFHHDSLQEMTEQFRGKSFNFLTSHYSNKFLQQISHMQACSNHALQKHSFYKLYQAIIFPHPQLYVQRKQRRVVNDQLFIMLMKDRKSLQIIIEK